VVICEYSIHLGYIHHLEKSARAHDGGHKIELFFTTTTKWKNMSKSETLKKILDI